MKLPDNFSQKEKDAFDRSAAHREVPREELEALRDHIRSLLGKYGVGVFTLLYARPSVTDDGTEPCTNLVVLSDATELTESVGSGPMVGMLNKDMAEAHLREAGINPEVLPLLRTMFPLRNPEGAPVGDDDGE